MDLDSIKYRNGPSSSRQSTQVTEYSSFNTLSNKTVISQVIKLQKYMRKYLNNKHSPVKQMKSIMIINNSLSNHHHEEEVEQLQFYSTIRSMDSAVVSLNISIITIIIYIQVLEDLILVKIKVINILE